MSNCQNSRPSYLGGGPPEPASSSSFPSVFFKKKEVGGGLKFTEIPYKKWQKNVGFGFSADANIRENQS